MPGQPLHRRQGDVRHARRAGRLHARGQRLDRLRPQPRVNSAERLDFERKVLFATPFTLGRHKLRQEVQDAPYVESPLEPGRRHLRHAQRAGVVQQPLRHRARPGRVCGPQRRRHRLAARDLRRSARPPLGGGHDHLASRPGLGRDRPDPRPAARSQTLVQTGTDPDGYHDLLSALRDDTTAFRRPVAVVHGDSHYFRIDKPFLDAQGGAWTPGC